MTAPRLEGEGLAYAYGERVVLRDAGIALAPGELVGLIGPNGAGKTTLVRLLAGFLVPERGTVRLDGVPIASCPRRTRARTIAFVPQDPRVEFPYTVLEVVLMGRAPHLRGLGFAGADDLARAREALALLELHGVEDRRLDALSGGERQRVFLARALAQEPSVLLLDEPTTHLDLRHQAAILDVVRARVRTGTAALAVLHDLNVAATACDRLVLLAGGGVHAAGSAATVLTRPHLTHAFGAAVHVGRHELADVPVVMPLAPRRP